MIFIALVGAAAISVAPIHDGAAPNGLSVAVSTPLAPGGLFPQDRAATWSLGHGYARSGEHILFEGGRIDRSGRENLDEIQAALGRPVVVAQVVDAASFAALSEEYANDKSSAYYKWVSPGEFWIVEIPGADAAAARVVNPGWAWKDRRTVHDQFTPLGRRRGDA